MQETGNSDGVDREARLPQDGTAMATSVYERERRSSRVFMRVKVVVAGKNTMRKRFREACETIVINAHGGLIYSLQRVEKGEILTLTNPFTQDEQEVRVVFLGEETEKAQLVGLEFLTPAPHFWGIEFAQPDWHSNPVVSTQSN